MGVARVALRAAAITAACVATPSLPPSASPSPAPSLAPSGGPTAAPSGGPTAAPNPAGSTPSSAPSAPPSTAPSESPTDTPTSPSAPPSATPTAPSASPSAAPTGPSKAPVAGGAAPTASPVSAPSLSPTNASQAAASPSAAPSASPGGPSAAPTVSGADDDAACTGGCVAAIAIAAVIALGILLTCCWWYCMRNHPTAGNFVWLRPGQDGGNVLQKGEQGVVVSQEGARFLVQGPRNDMGRFYLHQITTQPPGESRARSSEPRAGPEGGRRKESLDTSEQQEAGQPAAAQPAPGASLPESGGAAGAAAAAGRRPQPAPAPFPAAAPQAPSVAARPMWGASAAAAAAPFPSMRQHNQPPVVHFASTSWPPPPQQHERHQSVFHPEQQSFASCAAHRGAHSCLSAPEAPYNYQQQQQPQPDAAMPPPPAPALPLPAAPTAEVQWHQQQPLSAVPVSDPFYDGRRAAGSTRASPHAQDPDVLQSPSSPPAPPRPQQRPLAAHSPAPTPPPDDEPALAVVQELLLELQERGHDPSEAPMIAAAILAHQSPSIVHIEQASDGASEGREETPPAPDGDDAERGYSTRRASVPPEEPASPEAGGEPGLPLRRGGSGGRGLGPRSPREGSLIDRYPLRRSAAVSPRMAQDFTEFPDPPASGSADLRSQAARYCAAAADVLLAGSVPAGRGRSLHRGGAAGSRRHYSR
eukprot:TRINITY_DN2108_c0_g1_i3.p1 TRINITY_DN2108_c0_g1~~TRINITY_DN2108_c0_g1_i3.p1  ORF type:complete len:721 (+),score=134.70 TRINITY_DN2108_c0_g1_i3:66-2165(+)